MLPGPPLWQPMASPNPDGGDICSCAVAVVIVVVVISLFQNIWTQIYIYIFKKIVVDYDYKCQKRHIHIIAAIANVPVATKNPPLVHLQIAWARVA